VADLSPEDAEAVADQILPLISRAAPEPIERAELVDTSGLETDELRAGLAWLEEKEQIREEGGGYVLASAAPAASSSANGDGADDEEAPETSDPASPASVPGSGENYRATFDVMVTFGEKRDEAALQAAAAMETEIAELIHAKYPGAVLSVDVSKVEAYKPRVIYGGDEPEES
jgi:hypothetical protein